MTVVDVHCHTFNGDDLPVKGFVYRVLLHNVSALRVVSWVLDNVGQIGTPGYEAERAQLDRLLSDEPYGLSAMALVQERPFDQVVNEAFQALQSQDPVMLAKADQELRSPEEEPAGPEAFSPVSGLLAAKRAIAWAVLLRRSRLDITRRLVQTYPEVDLFTPLTVDLSVGLKDDPEVPLLLQVQLQEKIGRLSLLGRLGPGLKAHVHPFIGFDPRSELRSNRTGDVMTPFEVVKLAVERYGFIGVKLYPPMGFRPTKNVPTTDMTAEQATAVDEILDKLYTWCEAKDVPITVHCNASNEAKHEYRLCSDPTLWAEVIDRHPGLHLNLGHFGGARLEVDPTDPASEWPEQIARLASSHDHLYADTGDHRIEDSALADAYMTQLVAMFSPGQPTAAMKKQVMYGSDWYMLALLTRSDGFLDDYRARWEKAFPDGVSRFMGEAALEFLGFSQKGNQNRERLIARYQQHDTPLPGWLA